MKKILKTLLLIVVVFVGACGGSADEFTGKWKSLKKNHTDIEITKNGTEFIYKEGPWRDPLSGQVSYSSFPATEKEHMLQIQGGLGTATFAIDKSTGHLIGGGSEYQKMQ